MPGQGTDNRSQQAGAKQNVRTSPLVISEGEASVELGGDTSGGEVAVEGVTETFAAPVVNGQSEFIWYYHPDHLGSTGFVTDQNGELYEHIEYFPFGETWCRSTPTPSARRGANIHYGFSDNRGYQSRGSEGCYTIHPSEVDEFMRISDWNPKTPTKGTSYGSVYTYRGYSREALDLLIMFTKKLKEQNAKE